MNEKKDVVRTKGVGMWVGFMSSCKQKRGRWGEQPKTSTATSALLNNKGKIEQTKEAKGIMLTSKKKTLCMRTKAVCTGTMVVCGNRLFHETGAEVEEREREEREVIETQGQNLGVECVPK